MTGARTPIVGRPRRVIDQIAAELPRTGGTAARRLPEGATLVAAAGALLAALGVGGIALEPSGDILPFDTATLDPIDAAVSVVILVALAVGLARGKRLAWYLAVAAFGSALVLQLLVLGHAIAGGVAAICLGALLSQRMRYRAASDRTVVGLAAFALALGAVLVAAQAVVIDLATGHVRNALAAFSDWLSMSDPVGIGRGGGEFAVDVLALATRLLLAVAALVVLRAVADRAAGPAERDLAENVGRRYATGGLVPFLFGPDTEPFFGPDDDSLIVYGRAGRTAVVLGDPIGPSASWSTTFASFIERCATRDVVPTVYQASETALPMLAEARFRSFKVGQEAIVDLEGFSLQGSRRANLRHTIARAGRGGVSVRWFPNGMGTEDLSRFSNALVALDRAWQRHAGPRLGFTVGTFLIDDLARVPVALAIGPDDEPIAMVTFRPTDPGRGWVLGLIRRRADSTPGAVESCIAEAAAGLRALGGTTLSLGLAPLAGLDARAGNGPERLLALAAKLARRWYDVEGLAFFKGKFDPRWEPRYGAVRHRHHLIGFATALLRLHLAGRGGSVLVAGRAAIAAAAGGTMGPGERRG